MNIDDATWTNMKIHVFYHEIPCTFMDFHGQFPLGVWIAHGYDGLFLCSVLAFINNDKIQKIKKSKGIRLNFYKSIRDGYLNKVAIGKILFGFLFFPLFLLFFPSFIL